MKIIIYAMTKLSHQVERAESFKKGIQKHNFDVEIAPHTHPANCDLAVFWGMHHSKPIRNLQEKNNKPWLMMERGYMGDRFYWTSLAYNGLNGRGDFLNKNSPPDRWEKHFSHLLEPWHEGTYILVTAQVPGDASMSNLPGSIANYKNIVKQIKENTDMPIWFRPHPNRGIRAPEGVIVAGKKTLKDEIGQAHCVVTYNSNTCVDATLNGTPCIVFDEGAMAWSVCMHDYENINTPQKPDRTQWCYDMAYTQWSPEEIENGDAWEHLKGKFEKINEPENT